MKLLLTFMGQMLILLTLVSWTFYDHSQGSTLTFGTTAAWWQQTLSKTMITTPSFGLHLGVKHGVALAWNFETEMMFEHMEFSGARDRDIDTDSYNFVKLTFGLNRSFGRSSFGLGLRLEQIPLLMGAGDQLVRITSFNVISPYIKGRLSLQEYGRTGVDLQGQVYYHLPATSGPYQLKEGVISELSLPIQRQLTQQKSFTITPIFSFGNRKTNTIDHQEIKGGMNISFNYDL
jgi:hypothetical protein